MILAQSSKARAYAPSFCVSKERGPAALRSLGVSPRTGKADSPRPAVGGIRSGDSPPVSPSLSQSDKEGEAAASENKAEFMMLAQSSKARAYAPSFCVSKERGPVALRSPGVSPRTGKADSPRPAVGGIRSGDSPSIPLSVAERQRGVSNSVGHN
jgi:hypothetical protein